MTTKSKNLVSLAAVLMVGIGTLVLVKPAHDLSDRQGKVVDAAMIPSGRAKAPGAPLVASGHGKVVDAVIARNVSARGGADAWRNVDTLQLTGKMDVGQGLRVPYVMEQKRPGKMCLEFDFDNQTATQCVDGQTGWKRLPFMGRTAAEPMTGMELSEMAGAANLDGLLFDSDKHGYKVELIGPEAVNGKHTTKLKVTLPGGALRWVYIDDETGLEVKIEATRALRGQERLVETTYSDWQRVEGLLISRRQETRYKGEKGSYFVTVESVRVNLPLEDSRFAMPAAGGVESGLTQEKSS